jgi:indole-3-glycerol phosphate synthase
LVSGASALSVLTDREYFGGSLADLSAVRSAVSIPVLRKDFLVSNVQILEARSSGADAVLLIVGILGDSPLTELRLQAEELGMTALVEVHANELDRALDSGASVIGINNRDLRSFTVRLETTLSLLDSVPDSVVLVSESGIRTRSDVEVLARAGVDAVLVGEALLRAPVPGKMVSELSGVPSSTRSPASVRR